MDSKGIKYNWEYSNNFLGLFDLPEHEIDQILSSCLRLETNPHPDGKHIKKLKGYKKDIYRLRIGDYRAVFE
jgi:mRNA interferase RelE/StbE